MSCHRKNSPQQSHYTINGTVLERVDQCRDLGIIIDHKLTFVPQVESVIAKANALLGFISRTCRDMNNPHALRTIYCSFVRSILEYGCLVWQPRFETHANRLELVQRRFTRFALRKLGWNYDAIPSYHLRCQLLSIDSLAVRRKLAAAMFMFDILGNRIDCSNLLASVNINVPSRQTRNYSLLRPTIHRTVYGQHEPINRISVIFNEFQHLFDFGMSRASYKERVLVASRSVNN